MIKVAIIGAGNIARTVHIPTYQTFEDVVCVGIADINLKLLHETADQFHIEGRYVDYKQMILETKPDLVSICTPNAFHSSQAVFALEHGAHVLCEKPPAMNIEELGMMKETSIKHQKHLVFNLHHRLRDDVSWMKSWVKEKPEESIYFGEVFALRRQGVPGWGYFTNQKLSGGGPLIDIGVHMLDTALYVLGFPKISYVSATMSNRIGIQGGIGDFGPWDGSQFSVEDSLFGHIVFENGTSIQIQTAFLHHMDQKSKMNIQLYRANEACSLKPFRIQRFDQTIQAIDYEIPVGLSHVSGMIKRLHGEHVDLPEVESVWLTQWVMGALYESARMNRAVYYLEKSSE